MSERAETVDGRFERLWLGLHVHKRNGYERGDCHCSDCYDRLVLLMEHFGITPGTHRDPTTGMFNPAAAVRDAAHERGWIG